MKRISEMVMGFCRELHLHLELLRHEGGTAMKFIAKMDEEGSPVIKRGFGGIECDLVAESKGPGVRLALDYSKSYRK